MTLTFSWILDCRKFIWFQLHRKPIKVVFPIFIKCIFINLLWVEIRCLHYSEGTCVPLYLCEGHSTTLGIQFSLSLTRARDQTWTLRLSCQASLHTQPSFGFLIHVLWRFWWQICISKVIKQAKTKKLKQQHHQK